jgi:hypothetical protein
MPKMFVVVIEVEQSCVCGDNVCKHVPVICGGQITRVGRELKLVVFDLLILLIAIIKLLVNAKHE